MLVRRARAVAGGDFDPAFARSGEDYWFHRRSCFLGPVALIEASTTSYRIGAGDQLTSPRWAHERARDALVAVRHWVDATGRALHQPPRAMRQRIAELQRWGRERQQMLDADRAAAHLVASLQRDPLRPRRWALLLATLPACLRNAMLLVWRARPIRLRRARCTA